MYAGRVDDAAQCKGVHSPGDQVVGSAVVGEDVVHGGHLVAGAHARHVVRIVRVHTAQTEHNLAAVLHQ